MLPSTNIAHRQDGQPDHLLADHLLAVAKLAESFASKFDAGSLAYALGIAHDIGKADPEFQAYIRGHRPKHEGGHAYPGALVFNSVHKEDAFHECYALPIAGHHAGMPDNSQWKRRIALHNQSPNPLTANLTEFYRNLNTHTLAEPPWLDKENPSQIELLTRMLLSCLVDADRFDTERYFNPRQDSIPTSLTFFQTILNQHLHKLAQTQTSALIVHNARQDVLAKCRSAAQNSPGFYRLTVPTGGGKTLASLAFAIDHAIEHQRDRIIYAIPFTSILDQTYDQFAKLFTSENLLAHYSTADTETVAEKQSSNEEQAQESISEEVRKRLAAVQNWDAPLILTTTVQLFESLFSNRPSRCRKLHNIARSVIILDEVQTLPADLLKPILDGLHQLVQNYGCTVVLCTATQPDYSPIKLPYNTVLTEIVPNYQEHFAQLRRVNYSNEPDEISDEELLNQMDEHLQVLSVLNLKKSAIRLSHLAQSRPTSESYLHLSTNLCAYDRRNRITEIRRRLDSNEPIRLISTQVIEAGVDVDFPRAMRAFGPLDRIIQTAGRCNRNGHQTLGEVTIFNLAEDEFPLGAYKTATDATRKVLRNLSHPLDDPETVRKYWRQYLNDTNLGEDLQTSREKHQFATVGQKLKLIDEPDQNSVIYNHPELKKLQLLDEYPSTSPRAWFRRIQPFIVNISTRTTRELRNQGLLTEHACGLEILDQRAYDSDFGVTDVSDPSDICF